MLNVDSHELLRKNVTTLKHTSFDKEHNEYMTDSDMLVVNYDSVKTDLLNSIGLSEECAKSIDALCFFEDSTAFVEFKNGGNISNNELRVKASESLLALSMLTGLGLDEIRKVLDLIVVYNESRNPIHDNEKKRLDCVSSKIAIAEYFFKKGGRKFIRFGLDKYENLFFKEVNTYSKSQFEQYIDSKESLL